MPVVTWGVNWWRRSPPIATLSRIAKVLGVRVGYFFRDEGPEEAFEVVRKDDRPSVTQSAAGEDQNRHGDQGHARQG